jgi:hypothetical protein
MRIIIKKNGENKFMSGISPLFEKIAMTCIALLLISIVLFT